MTTSVLWQEALETIKRLEAENFALSADQCEAGYGDEYGNHRCRYKDSVIGPDWQLAAFDKTLELARARKMLGTPSLDLTHLEDMRTRITPDFSRAKLGRWLGWAQASVVASRCGTLDEMKEINRLCSSNQ